MAKEINLIKDVQNYLYNIYKNVQHDQLAVAVSGGRDSIALLDIISKTIDTKKITAITINHNLRKEAQLEIKFVNDFCKNKSINHIVLDWEEGKKTTSNIQELARKARYKLLTNYCNQNKIKILFIGHNKNDVAENFLIRLSRGSGLDGLASMKQSQIINKVNVIRPLLFVRRDIITNYLIQKKINWIDDNSNNNPKYLRIKIRQEIEHHHQYINRISTAAHHLRLASDFINNHIQKIEEEIVEYNIFGVAKIHIPTLKKYDFFIIQTIISKVISNFHSDNFKPNYQVFLGTIKKILSGDDFNNSTISNTHLTIFKKHFLIIYSSAISTNTLFKNSCTNWNNIWNIELLDQSMKKNLYISSLGKKGWQNFDKTKFNLKEFDRILPRKILFSLPVIKTIENIVYAPHINNDNNNYLKITFKLSKNL